MSPEPPFIGYHAMRLRWCRLALLQFLRRWGIYLVVGAAAVGAGANSPAHAVAGVAAWSVMPIFSAAQHGLWLLPGTLLQALLGLACVWGLRTLLWPVHWREAEAALPIDARERLRSDIFVVAVALSPLALLQAAGAGAMVAGQRGGLAPAQGLALLALLLSNAAALGLGVALLQRQRRPAGGWLPPVGRSAPVATRVRGAWPLALLLRPLWRGPARRTGRLLVLACLLLALPGVALWLRPAAMPWWLALLAAAALMLVTRLHTLAREEYTPLFDATTMLPLRRLPLERLRAALCLLPLLAATLALAPGLLRTAARPAVLLAYAAALAGACIVEVLSRPAEPADKAARWIFSLVLCLALASEVAP
jgi:hypothetical protein